MTVGTIELDPWFVALACGVLGLLVGSFANVVAWRVPRGESVVRPGSHCPACGHTLAWWENVPLVSWAALRARCSACDVAISARYPAVELVTGLGFAAVGYRFAGDPWLLPAALLLVGGLVPLTVIDLEHFLLPNRVVYPLGLLSVPLLVLASAGTGDWWALARAGIGALGYFGAFYLLWFAVRGRALGFGDVRLAFVLGLHLGWLGALHVLVGMFLPFLIGSILGILAVAPVLVIPMALAGALGAAVGPDVVAALFDPGGPDDPARARALVGGAAAVFAGSLAYLAGSLTRRLPRGRQIPFGPAMAVGALLVVLLGPLPTA